MSQGTTLRRPSFPERTERERKTSARGTGRTLLLTAVEVCGGGSRGPMIRNAIRYTCGRDEGYFASCSFDDSLLAFGASLVGAIDATIDKDDDDYDCTLCKSRLCEAEGRMMQRADAQRDRGPDFRIALGTLRPPQRPPAEYGRICRVPQWRGRLAILGRVRQCDARGDGVAAGRVKDGRCARRSTKRRTEIVMMNKNDADELFSGGNYPHPGTPRP